METSKDPQKLPIISMNGSFNNNFNGINEDFSNIESVYYNNLKKWHINNSDVIKLKTGNSIYIDGGTLQSPESILPSKTKKGISLSDVEFIDSEIDIILNLDTGKFSESLLKKLESYSLLLSKKRINVEWTLRDHFNHYLKTKRFGFTIIREFNNGQYTLFKDEMKKYLFRYDYFFNNLTSEDKVEFKNDFCDQLEKLQKKQTISKFKEIIVDAIILVDKKYEDHKNQSNHQNPEDSYVNENWFKVGLLFANGEMDRLINEHFKNTTRIAKSIDPIKWSSYRPYISESISVKPSQKDKCIFANKTKMQRIISYCEENNIMIVKSFSDRLPQDLHI